MSNHIVNGLKVLILLIVVMTMGVVTGCRGSKDQVEVQVELVQLTVAVAASLQDAVEELTLVYTKRHTGVTIINNFASSGTLQRQIEEGAPVDIFISAGQSQMDALASKGLIVENSRQNLLGNELVLIAKTDSPLTGFDGLTNESVARICIGTPETVPAGKYARETLITLGMWDKLQSKLVLAKDVRQVLTYVQTGNVDAGMVYRSDAMAGKEVKIVAVAPDNAHKPIIYPMAVIKGTKQQKAAEDFAAFLAGDEAARVFQKYGFGPVK